MPAAAREYKDRLFTFIFGSEEHKDWTLSLYNAINQSLHTDPDEIELNTIKEVLYLSMRNDVSFILANEMNMYEQQSTYNPNMPLRMLQYASSLYEKYLHLKGGNKYGKTLVPLPAPRLVVFYNGERQAQDEELLLLSNAFPADLEHDIEVRVRMVNVNEGHNASLMEACRPLREYAWTIERVREKMNQTGTHVDRAQAIIEVIESMPADFVIKPYLAAHKAEVIDMLLTEYNEAEAMELFRKEGEALGETLGEARGIRGMVRVCRSYGASLDEAVRQVAEALDIPLDEARERVLPCWT